MRYWNLDFGDHTKIMNILEIILYYVEKVDKKSYPEFDDWKKDMIKHGLLTKVSG